ncbi:MAG: hypothetical protein HGA22_15285, partial [Clostridiales bacterium]|nr:hypothetical protein [Clostridiales bacterium]
MNIMTEANETGFDLAKAGRIANAYSQSTGVGCLVIDSRGRTLFEAAQKGQPEGQSCLDNQESKSCKPSQCGQCKFCTKFQSITGNKSSCQTVHRYGAYQAERFGGRYVFFCPLGMVHWASPISVNNSIGGALIGGPVLMVDPEQFMLEELMEESGLDPLQFEGLKEYVSEVPVIKTDVVESMSELLSILAGSISTQGSFAYDEQKQFNEFHADISESIHYMKLLNGEDEEKLSYPFEKEKELLSSISNGDKKTAQKVLNEILGTVFFASGKDFNIIKAHVIELVVLLSRAAMEGGADSEVIFGLNYKYLSDIDKFKSVEEITFWLSKILER